MVDAESLQAIGHNINQRVTLPTGQIVDVIRRPVQFSNRLTAIHFRMRRVEFQPIGRSTAEVAMIPVDKFTSIQAVTIGQFGIVNGTPLQFTEDKPTPQFRNRRDIAPKMFTGKSVDESLRDRRQSGNERHTRHNINLQIVVAVRIRETSCVDRTCRNTSACNPNVHSTT